MSKGAILDTNASVKDATKYMLTQQRVAAFGKVKDCIKDLTIGDTVFLYLKGVGVIAAATATSTMQNADEHTNYCDVEFIALPKPTSTASKPYLGISAKQIKELLNRNFFWAKTLKSPYLSERETQLLLKQLQQL